MAKYNSYNAALEIVKKNLKRKGCDFSADDPHNEIKQQFSIRFNAIEVRLKIIEELVKKVVKKFNF